MQGRPFPCPLAIVAGVWVVALASSAGLVWWLL